ncbi:hypothetical protein DGG96_19455 [Legionella qingyii]|uniref:Uncharacterized protein n=1 Tax=Legionella qingyii TaxID=2184757 RepID=A0A317TX33_9GAMM|nr:hypothetical protein [Legionella qingyii]PWY53983.1 hypothetical protein DGG96_19455 [Legionella qingyii]RUR21309.1 hypothetical protein ELY20_12470 [Legionella qingyii]RUR24533.1 hypothetical protein ELY16_11305 [Legionella qingyii]
MHENFMSTLLSPITLLFLVEAFFLIFVTAFVWNIFLNMQYTNFLFQSFNKTHNVSAILLKSVLFVPIVLIGLIAEYEWSLLTHANFFPLISSPFVRFNFVGFIVSLSALIFIKNLDKKERASKFEVSIFFVTYILVLYLFYLIILMGTVIIRLNAFPDGFLRSHSYPVAQRINLYVLGALFLVHLLVVFLAVSVKTLQRVLLLLTYTIALAAAYSMVF